jgi:pimeloyl-ACP methyl ester carboxylesterase
MRLRIGILCLGATLALMLALSGCSQPPAATQPASKAPGIGNESNAASPSVERAYAEVRGIRLYYEVHGQGGEVPLVLLPGGGSTIDVTYGRLLPLLGRNRKLIAIEEQNHGRSEHRDVPERFTDSADDVSALLGQLGIPQADVMGFSNGGSVALQVAIRHPGLVRKLIFAGSMTKKSGAPAQFWEMMARGTFADMPQSLKTAHLKVDPDPQKLRDMYEKDAERMRNFVDTPDEDVKSVDIPTLVLMNDRDVPSLEHAIELTRLLPQVDLVVLPGGHGAFLGEEEDAKTSFYTAEVSSLLIEGFLANNPRQH